jgi:two-component sensor histidine kinase
MLAGVDGAESLPALLLEQMPVGIVIALAPSGEIIFQNRRAGAILGQDIPLSPEMPADIYVGAFHLDGRPFGPDDHAVVRVLANGRPIQGESCRYRRPDGSTVELSFDADLIRDRSGVPALAVATFQDVTAEREAERARAALERRLARVLEATTDSVFVVDAGWRLTFLNGNARAQIAGGRELVGMSLWEAFPEAIGSPFWASYHECMASRRPTVARERYDPLGMAFEAHAYPFEEGIVVFFRDVTSEIKAEEAQRQLTRELAHRVGNLFTLVIGMVKMTARTASSAAEMADKLTGRIVALARAHDLVRPGGLEAARATPTTLAALVQAVVAPHRDGGAAIEVACEGVSIGPDAATALALVLHELATNSAKYGALSRSGLLSIAVERHDADRLGILWRETVDRSPSPPAGPAGFGSTLVRATARGRLGGDVAYDWGANGLTVRIDCEASRLAS